MRALVAVGLLVGSTASAEPPNRLATVPLVDATAEHAQTATVLFLNRCKGGCTIHKGGVNHAPSHTSQIPDGPQTDYTLTEFAHGDAKWNDFMTCMRELYSPYGVTVTDQLPVGGIAYNEGIVAGLDSELGLSGVGGIAPVTSDCSPYAYVIWFSFANGYSPNDTTTLCAVAGQETAHSFGLDHSFEFIDGQSACKDPMSYRGDCGGQRFFRNQAARCGEFSERDCRCGATQNSHLKLTTVLGPGTPITRPPTVNVSSPMANAVVHAGDKVVAIAGSQRGVAAVELWINGYKWAETVGVGWGPSGQPMSAYQLALPDELPDSVIDVVVKAKDDIGVATDSATLRLTKGAACSTADTCAKGQRCDAEGRCLWDPPTGQLGDPCEYTQFCESGVCQGTADESRCTQACSTVVEGTCPEDFECLETSGTTGICWPGGEEKSTCGCATGRTPPIVPALLGFGVLFVLGRRRR